MSVAVLCVIAALLLGKAGLDEMYYLGIRQNLVQPFWAGLIGFGVAMVIAVAGVGLWRRWGRARELALGAAALSIVFHIYGALPPHRNVGIIGAVVGVAAGLVLLTGALRHRHGAPPGVVTRGA